MSVPEIMVNVFGKNECAKCRTTKAKITHFLSRWKLDKQVRVIFHDLDTVDGMAEGAFYDVNDLPVTIIMARGRSVARWDGRIPNSNEVRLCLDNLTNAAAG